MGAAKPPLDDWAHLAPALIVRDLAESLGFWTGILGFTIGYERQEDEFVYLTSGRAHVMLYQRCDAYETAALEPPYGRGVMFQIEVENVDAVLRQLTDRRWPVYQGLREAWYRAGPVERGCGSL